MKISLFIRKLPVFVKLFLAFMTVLVPLYTASLSLNTLSKNSVKSEISKNTGAQVHYYISVLENEFSRILNEEKVYINDYNLQDLSISISIMDEYEKMTKVKNVGKYIFFLENSSKYIAEINVYVKSLNRVITTDQTLLYVTEEQKKLFEGYDSIASTPFIFSGNELYMIVPYPGGFRAGQNRDILFSMNIKISRNEIINQLNKLAGGSLAGAILADKAGRWYISNDDRKDIALSVKELVANKISAGSNSGIESVKLGKLKYLVAYELSPYLGTTLTVYFPEKNILGKLQEYRIRFIITSIFAVIFIALFSYWMFTLVARPLRRLTDAFRNVEKGVLSTVITHNKYDDFGYLYLRFNKMLEELTKLIEQVYEQKILAQRAELKQLQYQINPHFLYNSFFQIYTMAKESDFDTICIFTDHLRQYYQYLTLCNVDQITLMEELKHTINYVNIQSVRFKNRIRAEIDNIPQGYEDFMIPRLVIQPLIENSYEHGLKKKTSGGILRVTIRMNEDYLIINVEDNGDFIGYDSLQMLRELIESDADQNSAAKSRGLFNVHRRIRIRFGGKSGISVDKSELGGIKVTLLIYKEENDNV